MSKYLSILMLLVSAHSFAYFEATDALLSILDGVYHGNNCEVRVNPVKNGVRVEVREGNKVMDHFVAEGSGFQYKPYGRFVSSFRIKESSVNYTEFTFLTTPTNSGRYSIIEKRIVRNTRTERIQAECETY